uniref:RRM domain-containing protein n=1 Tax=Chromera velia CCMP2878 TaxID=1169474 RepID=A0A0G4GVI7_9ALVE|eukprot:Cvel_23547.t1-p1 / transcript=Cvel_23547.t1 / gene=Cvel_23547 / organism=Chromera_velia_CCMP2878 / gene_product=CUGBP Elav-like family member 3, putative / transcript_product=CUGBP Elav-like family member 3, putative / location=Cvel_scaffold2439:2007-3507(-) / protein_length=361 / sequence_SO=supercontig / SO=protein_coding / is_pseudo=false
MPADLFESSGPPSCDCELLQAHLRALEKENRCLRERLSLYQKTSQPPLHIAEKEEPSEEPDHRDFTRQDECNLFVFHIPKQWNEETLHKHFRPFGPIVSAIISRESKTGRNKGFGFVCYQFKGDAQKAIERMNRQYIGGKRLSVTVKRQQEQASALTDLSHSSSACVMTTGTAEGSRLGGHSQACGTRDVHSEVRTSMSHLQQHRLLVEGSKDEPAERIMHPKKESSRENKTACPTGEAPLPLSHRPHTEWERQNLSPQPESPKFGREEESLRPPPTVLHVQAPLLPLREPTAPSAGLQVTAGHPTMMYLPPQSSPPDTHGFPADPSRQACSGVKKGMQEDVAREFAEEKWGLTALNCMSK